MEEIAWKIMRSKYLEINGKKLILVEELMVTWLIGCLWDVTNLATISVAKFPSRNKNKKSG